MLVLVVSGQQTLPPFALAVQLVSADLLFCSSLLFASELAHSTCRSFPVVSLLFLASTRCLAQHTYPTTATAAEKS
jgi:hypothetical protein